MFYCSLYMYWNKELFSKIKCFILLKGYSFHDGRLMTETIDTITYLVPENTFFVLWWIIHMHTANTFYKGAIFPWYLSYIVCQSKTACQRNFKHSFSYLKRIIWSEGKLLNNNCYFYKPWSFIIFWHIWWNE